MEILKGPGHGVFAADGWHLEVQLSFQSTK